MRTRSCDANSYAWSSVLTLGELLGLTLRLDKFLLETLRLISPRKSELAILEYLMRHAGWVVSRRALMTHTWDSNVDLFSNSVCKASA